jgi:hypothetical protein
VNAKKMAVVLGFVVGAGFGTTALCGDFFTDRGSMWAGGSMSYINENVRGNPNPMNMFLLSPDLRFFPVPYLVVGPAVSWEIMSQSGEGFSSSSGMLSIGPELGFAFGKNIPVVPYVLSGVRYEHDYSSDSYTSVGAPSQTSKSGADGYSIPLAAGIMAPLVNGLGIQLETGFIYHHTRNYTSAQNSDMSAFVISVGVCGIGKNLGVSFLNTVSDLML